MNYLMQILGFRLKRKLHPLTTSAIALYYILLENFNQVGFPTKLSIPIGVLSGETSMSETTVRSARNELMNSGFIIFNKGSVNRASVYSLIELNPRNDQTVDIPIKNSGNTSESTNLEKKFYDFWQLYPRKSAYNESKQLYFHINPSDEFQQRILASLSVQISQNNWSKSASFVPTPANWLRNEGWRNASDIDIEREIKYSVPFNFEYNRSYFKNGSE